MAHKLLWNNLPPCPCSGAGTVGHKFRTAHPREGRGGGGGYSLYTPVLAELHWLPVEKRIIIKIRLLTYKALQSQAPIYISELLVPYKPARTLRSSSALLLKQHKYNLKNYGYRQFQVSAPCLWNSLPKSIKSASSVNFFKSKLKTYLYEQSYT